MAGKIQVPAVGGLRKVVKTGSSVNPGTTIAEYGSGTITLAQLKAALGVSSSSSSGSKSGTGAAASLNVGPGLAGGGVLTGAVGLQLVAPIPFMIGDDDGGGDGETGPPGLNGLPGPTGGQGPVGPAVFFLPDDPESALDAVPGSVGPQGVTGAAGPSGPAVFFLPDDPESALDAVPGPPGLVGATGPQGLPGPAVFLLADGEDGEMGPPGPAGSSSGSSSGGNVTPDTHPSIATAWDDEFEFGSTIDTTGGRRAGANAWSWLNQSTATAVVASGGLILIDPATGGDNWRIVVQAAPSTSSAWTFTAKFHGQAFNNFMNNAIILYNSGNSKFLSFGPAENIGSGGHAIDVYEFPGFTGPGTSVFTSGGIPNTIASLDNMLYYQVQWDGSTNLSFWVSGTGYPGSFIKLFTQALSTYLTAITHIGLGCESNNGTNPAVLVCDWFRKTA